jgi:hypothetical protein
MKKALIAATIVGAAAAGVILYLTKGNRSRNFFDELTDGAQDAGKLASRHLRKTQKKINHILQEENLA